MLRRVTIVALVLLILLWIALRASNGGNAPSKPAHTSMAPPTSSHTSHTSRTRQEAPPPWEPLQASEPTLMKLANMGDRPAAERLFRETRQCLNARWFKDFFKGQTYETWLATNQPYLQAMDSTKRDRAMKKAEANIALGNSYERHCGNTDAILADGAFYPIALAAARLGDDDATACILSGLYAPPKMTPTQAAAFDSEAMALGRRALSHGHWNTVLALRTVYSYSGIEGQAGPVSHINSVDYLRVLNLLWRGTPRGTPESSELAKLIEAVENRVTPAEKFAAERSADETYARAFSGSGPVTNPDALGCD